jgi:hypothetical protein
MRRLTSILLIAAAAMFIVSSEASAAWTCTAHSRFGSNHGWGKNYDRASAAARALVECSIRGGDCRIISCVSDSRRRGHPCPSGWCD